MYKIPIGSAISELRGIFLFKKENHIFSMKGNMIHLDNFVIWNLFCLIPSWFILDIHPILFSNFLFFLRKENCYELCFFFGFMINLMQFFYLLWQKKLHSVWQSVRMKILNNQKSFWDDSSLMTQSKKIFLKLLYLFAFCLINYKKQSALVRGMLIIMITTPHTNSIQFRKLH